MERLDSDQCSVWTPICGAFGLRFVERLDSDLWRVWTLICGAFGL